VRRGRWDRPSTFADLVAAALLGSAITITVAKMIEVTLW